MFILASCGGNIFEQVTVVYKDATEKMADVDTKAELDEIQDVVEQKAKKIEETDEFKRIQEAVDNNDTVAIAKYKESIDELVDAVIEYEKERIKALVRVNK